MKPLSILLPVSSISSELSQSLSWERGSGVKMNKGAVFVPYQPFPSVSETEAGKNKKHRARLIPKHSLTAWKSNSFGYTQSCTPSLKHVHPSRHPGACTKAPSHKLTDLPCYPISNTASQNPFLSSQRDEQTICLQRVLM